MPACFGCGNFFSTTFFDTENGDTDVCPACRNSSNPRSYTSSVTWSQEAVTEVMFEGATNYRERTTIKND